MKDLEDPGKNAGRDFIFRKLEGGVAAKLAAFETKKDDASVTPSVSATPSGVHRSRANSNASRVPSGSEAYGIEAPTRLSRRSTAMDVNSNDAKMGSVADVVGEGFKKKLESLTGNLANKVQEQSARDGPVAPESSAAVARGPAALAQARKRIPQDVLDMIALSGVDQEVAINEYLQKGDLGKTKNWDHDEIMKQLGGEDAQEKKPVEAAKEAARKVSVPQDSDKKDMAAKADPKTETEPVITKKEVPIEEVIPSPVKEETQPAIVDQKISEPVAKTGAEIPPSAEPKVEPEQKAVPAEKPSPKQEAPSPKTSPQNGKPTGMSIVVNSNGSPETQSFNAASLPMFGSA
jgi:hypothetical protein